MTKQKEWGKLIIWAKYVQLTPTIIQDTKRLTFWEPSEAEKCGYDLI